MTAPHLFVTGTLYYHYNDYLFTQMLLPRLPTRPVRPIRWTYSSMVPGKSKLMTCFTLQMSSPRAATWSQPTNQNILQLQIHHGLLVGMRGRGQFVHLKC